MEVTPEDPHRRAEEVRRRQRSRAIAMALALAAFVLLMYFITIARMSGGQ
jgi:ferric-dicitrate binding protein FerR (iron transport regulator)